MKKQFRPEVLTIPPVKGEDIYMKPPTPQDQNGNKLVTPHAITKITRDILDTSIVPLTPMTPYTPIWKGDDLFFNPELKEYCFYHSVHTLVRPVKDSAPKETPPPIPNNEGDRDHIECMLVTKWFSYLYSITEEENYYSTPHNESNEYAVPRDVQPDKDNYSVSYVG